MLVFLIIAAALAVGLPLGLTAAYNEGWLRLVPSFLYETTWLVAFATTVIFVYLYRWRHRAFIQLYLLSMVVKLISCLGYSVLMILEDRPGAVANVIYFMAVYFIFTALEIAFLYHRISRSKPS